MHIILDRFTCTINNRKVIKGVSPAIGIIQDKRFSRIRIVR